MRTVLLEVGFVLLVLLTVFFVGHHVGARGVQIDWDAEKLARASAVVTRVQQNAVLGAKQDASNAAITKEKNEELAPVVQRIYVDRVRVGPASCGGPAAPANAESPRGGDDANPPSGLVREDVERDTRALTAAVEDDLATGRACQAFVRENGMAP